jgi:hypothetical protein
VLKSVARWYTFPKGYRTIRARPVFMAHRSPNVWSSAHPSYRRNTAIVGDARTQGAFLQIDRKRPIPNASNGPKPLPARPATELVPPCRRRDIPRKLCFSSPKKQLTPTAIGPSEPVSGWEFPLLSPAPSHGALSRQRLGGLGPPTDSPLENASRNRNAGKHSP